MTIETTDVVSLQFPLEVVEDWPPVALESIPFERRTGGYLALAAPLFVKDLSVGDLIAPKLDNEVKVLTWTHVARSKNTTVWLLRLRKSDAISNALSSLRALGCNTVEFEAGGSYSIDVPGLVPIEAVDAILTNLDVNEVAIAFPSLRHS